MRSSIILLIIIISLIAGCSKTNESYKYYHDLFNSYTNIIELTSNKGQSRLIVAPDFQGRIVCSTNTGPDGKKLGWINPDALKTDKAMDGSEVHGEERVWIGPLGGQYSFFYGQQKPLDENNWSVPRTFNAEPFKLISYSETNIKLKKDVTLTNFNGKELNMNLIRDIYLFENDEIEKQLKLKIPENISIIGYQTNHILTNADTVSWEKETGLATIWSLSSFKGTNNSVTFSPIKKGNDTIKLFKYLNAIEKDRLAIENNVAWYKTDGKYRSKIGIPSWLSTGLIGNYQPENNTLRIVQFSQHPEDSLYFNSTVTIQENPYSGESIAIYNHGPMDLSQGEENHFFELESMAALKELKPKESIHHYHRVFQFTGDIENLNNISQKVLGVNLKDYPF